jgi:hypothetical protein
MALEKVHDTKAVPQTSELFPKPARVTEGSWVYDKDLGCLVRKGGRNYFDHNEKRSDLASPAVIGGSMPAIKSMADGKYYETFRNYEKSVHRAGCEIVGHDPRWQEHIKPPQPFGGEKAHEADLVADVKRATEEVNTRKPGRKRYRARKTRNA